MGTFCEFIVLFGLFFLINYAVYMVTEVEGMPRWLQYKPWICRLCFTFWALIFTYITIWLSFHCLIIGIGGIILASMNALAMWIDQKQKTVRIEDYDDFEPHDIPIDIEIKGDEIIINKN